MTEWLLILTLSTDSVTTVILPDKTSCHRAAARYEKLHHISGHTSIASCTEIIKIEKK